MHLNSIITLLLYECECYSCCFYYFMELASHFVMHLMCNKGILSLHLSLVRDRSQHHIVCVFAGVCCLLEICHDGKQ